MTSHHIPIESKYFFYVYGTTKNISEYVEIIHLTNMKKLQQEPTRYTAMVKMEQAAIQLTNVIVFLRFLIKL